LAGNARAISPCESRGDIVAESAAWFSARTQGSERGSWMLTGKKVIVVGGTSGIGLATAELAKAQGAEVVIASRNPERVAAAAKKIGATGVAADVTNDESVIALFKQCGPVDHVVVTAAQLRTGPFKTVPMEDARATLEGKFWGPWRVARAAEIRAGGSLTLVSGFLSIRPRPNSAIVSAANAAIESLTRALALELAPVRVNCVSPGIIRTPFQDFLPPEQAANNIQNRIPLHREGKPEDVAELIVTLVENDFITGENFVIDGGMTMRIV
jgi:NAD(P)-dependent dehydrogenase (short-subunit alcohol dehydrogenase family)